MKQPVSWVSIIENTLNGEDKARIKEIVARVKSDLKSKQREYEICNRYIVESYGIVGKESTTEYPKGSFWYYYIEETDEDSEIAKELRENEENQKGFESYLHDEITRKLRNYRQNQYRYSWSENYTWTHCLCVDFEELNIRTCPLINEWRETAHTKVLRELSDKEDEVKEHLENQMIRLNAIRSLVENNMLTEQHLKDQLNVIVEENFSMMRQYWEMYDSSDEDYGLDEELIIEKKKKIFNLYSIIKKFKYI